MERVVACVLSALALALPSTALACGGAIDFEIRTDDQSLQRAEELLLSGQYVEAVDALAFYRPPDQSRRVRARLVSSTASVRFMAASSVDRELLDAVVVSLRALHAAHAEDPLLQARLAEALVLDPASTGEARDLVEDLASRDLIPEPEAWVTVARVRALAYDADGSWAALRKCARMAGSRSDVCRGLELSS